MSRLTILREMTGKPQLKPTKYMIVGRDGRLTLPPTKQDEPQDTQKGESALGDDLAENLFTIDPTKSQEESIVLAAVDEKVVKELLEVKTQKPTKKPPHRFQKKKKETEPKLD